MVIVGGGKAGARAAVAFRENAWKGQVTLIGDEALAPYDRPPLSKAAIMDEAEPQPVLLQVALHEYGHADLLEAIVLERVQMLGLDAQLRRKLLDGEILREPRGAQPLAQRRRRRRRPRRSRRRVRLLAIAH
jgi:hypothetical protein